MSELKNTPISVAAFITQSIAASGKTQSEVARDIGLPNPNAVSMLTTGNLKLPLNRIGSIARALDVNAAHLLRIVLREYTPDLLEVIEQVLERPLLSTNEARIIECVRAISGDRDLPFIISR